MIAFRETTLSHVTDVFANGLQSFAADGGDGDVCGGGRGHDDVA